MNAATAHQRSTAGTQQLTVDWTRCDGHGVCAALLPNRIVLDEWGFPIISDMPAEHDTSVRRTVAACPSLALRLTAHP